MRLILNLGLMIGIALTIGFGLSWYALTDGRLFGTIDVGPWTAWRDVGQPVPDPYTRAYIARNGGLVLGAAEGLQFVALADSDGQPLDRACTYRIEGVTPLARFWTLTAIDPRNAALVTRSDGLPNLASGRLARASDGAIEISVGTRLRPGNWLELTGEGPFNLVLTLYETAGVGGADDAGAAMPAIRREACA